MRRRSTCRGCGHRRLDLVLSLGTQPLANAFVSQAELAAKEPVYPLDVYFCLDCSLAQLLDVVDPAVLFRHYLYASSTSPAFVQHFHVFAEAVSARFELDARSLVVDIGSNDGILLAPFMALGHRVLGVDPAENIAAIAVSRGIPTIPRFFDRSVASGIVAEHGPAAVVTATNVFAHVDDLDELVAAVEVLLGPRGVFVVEAPYVLDLVEKALFDTVYHEHLSYYAVGPLMRLLSRRGLSVFDVERVGSHGGSLRVFAQRTAEAGPVSERCAGLVDEEVRRGLGDVATYRRLAERVGRNKRALLDLLATIRADGGRIVGYGAPAKGNTLLNHFGIDTSLVEYIVDDSPLKQGLFTPGTRIPIVGPERLERDRPTHVLLLAWNFADPIVRKLGHLRAAGTRFIVPVPEPTVLE